MRFFKPRKKEIQGKVKIPIKRRIASTKTFGEIGITDPSSEEIMSELLPPDGLKKFRNMRDNDPIIGGLFIRIEQIFKTASYTIEGPNKGIVEKQLNDLPDGISGLLADMASSFIFGFYLGEEIWEYGKDGMKLIDIEPRYQITITDFVSNKSYNEWDGGVKSRKYARQQTSGSNVDIPLEKCLHYIPIARCRNPYGVSFFRHIYKPYYYKASIEAAEALSIDRDLGGLPHLEAPEGYDFTKADPESPSYDAYVAATLEWAEDVVGAIRKDELQGLVTPSGWVFKIVRGDTRTTMPTTEVISRYNSEIAIGMLQLFAVMGGFASTNNANVEEMLTDFAASCDAFLSSMAEAINKQVIKRICEFNGKTTYPEIRFDKLKREKLDALASYVARLVDNGIIDPTITLEKALLRKIHVKYTTDDKKEIRYGKNAQNQQEINKDVDDESDENKNN